MRVLIVNTSEKTGGAAVAANRLKDALNNNGVKAKMLVRDKTTEDITVVKLPKSWLIRWNFLWERWVIFWHMHFSRKHLFEVDIANAGNDITQLPEFREADVIHLSWINQGMLSIKNIRKIIESGKPIVWTLHDIWPLTSICHLTLGCDKFKSHCAACKYLPSGGDRDLSYRVWEQKSQLYKKGHISFVACSRWLADEAQHSGLIGGQRVEVIPNPLNTQIYCRHDKQEARRALGLPGNQRLLLFAAQRTTNVNKGMNYLVEACQKLTAQYPLMKQEVGLVLLGGHAEDYAGQFNMSVYPQGYVNDEREIVKIYNAVDAFVLPSLSENLPNTIMEAMACGVPCIGFRVGGIPEMIDHRLNGYVANYCDADDLAFGIRWMLYDAPREQVECYAVQKVAANYSRSAVALRYIEVYHQAMKYKNNNL
uniref:Glycosyltransferase family 4 protein n=2 Tax=unclassified Prevotella TaxID=2638335 RepID=A0AB33IZ67_9BACT